MNIPSSDESRREAPETATTDAPASADSLPQTATSPESAAAPPVEAAAAPPAPASEGPPPATTDSRAGEPVSEPSQATGAGLPETPPMVSDRPTDGVAPTSAGPSSSAAPESLTPAAPSTDGASATAIAAAPPAHEAPAAPAAPDAVADSASPTPPSPEPSPPQDATPVAAPENAAPPATAEAPLSGAATATADPSPPGASAPPSQAGSGQRPQVRIGSRRGNDRNKKKFSRPTMGKEQGKPQAKPKPEPVPKPSVRQPLSDDQEAELQAALGGKSLDDVMVGQAEQAASTLAPRSKHQAKVVRVHADSVFFGIGAAHEAVAPLAQFDPPPEPGSEIEIVIVGQNTDGLYEVALPGAAIEVDDWADIVEGMVVEARVTGANVGGLECKVNNLRGFIPASHIALYRVENLNEFLEQRLTCVVTEVNKRRKNLVLSRRSLLEREQEVERQKRLESIEVGQVLDGVVRNLQPFGAFVDLGDGLDGLIHISQMSWDRIKHPSEVISEGEKVRVKIEKFDAETAKIGLSLRSLMENPWENIDQKFPVESVVEGDVTKLANFGAFVRLGPGVEGLIHISELAHQRVAQPSNVVREGERLQVKILSVDRESQRIALSRKAVIQPPPEMQKKKEETPAEEPAREPAVRRKSNSPLKGGVDRPSGGDQFGLKW